MTPRDVAIRACRDALRIPSLVLISGFIGFGSLAHESGLDLSLALISTVIVWSQPGQVAFAELSAAGATALAIVLAVSLANARFLPMAVSLMPLLRPGLKRKAWLYLYAQLLSVNSWAGCQRAFPQLPSESHHIYFVVFAAVCMTGGVIGTLLGYFATGALPRPVALGLVFITPVYFAMLFAGNRARPVVVALLAGAVTGPILFTVSPDWGVLATGLLAGTGAWWFTRDSA